MSIGKGPPQIITSPSPESEPKILSFEEFRHREPNSNKRYNNFHIYFGNGLLSEIFQKQKYYKKFKSEHLDMVISLRKKMESLQGTSKSLAYIEKDLYEAYKIMRSYGASDAVLFGEGIV